MQDRSLHGSFEDNVGWDVKEERSIYVILAVKNTQEGLIKPFIYVGSAKTKNLEYRIRQELHGDEIFNGIVMHQTKWLKDKTPVGCLKTIDLGLCSHVEAANEEKRIAETLNNLFGGTDWFGGAYGN